MAKNNQHVSVDYTSGLTIAVILLVLALVGTVVALWHAGPTDPDEFQAYDSRGGYAAGVVLISMAIFMATF